MSEAFLRGVADKFLAQPTSRCRRTDSVVSLERRSVHVPNCKSFLVTEAERKHVRRRARFQHRDASCQVFFSARPDAEGNSRHSERNITETCTIICHRQKLARTGRHKTVTTPKIFDQIHELILEDRRISAKSIVEQQGISRERVGSIIHEDLDIRKLSRSGSRNA